MSRPTFNIANPIYIVNKSADVDSRYGPWSSVQDANNNIDINIRQIGLTVGVSAVGTGVIEYWYKNDIQNTDLILKTTGGGGGGTIDLPLSGNWNSVYSTVNTNSANWSSIYTIVSNNSASWDNSFNTYTKTFPISGTNGSLVLNTSSNNVFFRVVSGKQIFSYTNFVTGKTIIVYLSALHTNERVHEFPIGTYFNGVGDSNYLLTYEGKVTKATITNIENSYYGFAEIIQTQYLNQTITKNIFDDNILLDGYIGFLLQEDGDRLVIDNILSPPPLSICVQSPNSVANGTYDYSWTLFGRPGYFARSGNGNFIQWDNYIGGAFAWKINNSGGNPYYISNSNTYLPSDAEWPNGVTVSVGAC